MHPYESTIPLKHPPKHLQLAVPANYTWTLELALQDSELWIATEQLGVYIDLDGQCSTRFICKLNFGSDMKR